MASVKLTIREKMDCLAEALQAELGGAIVAIKTLQRIDSRCTGNITRATYYRHVAYFEQEGAVECLEGVGVRVMPPDARKRPSKRDEAPAGASIPDTPPVNQYEYGRANTQNGSAA